MPLLTSHANKLHRWIRSPRALPRAPHPTLLASTVTAVVAATYYDPPLTVVQRIVKHLRRNGRRLGPGPHAVDLAHEAVKASTMVPREQLREVTAGAEDERYVRQDYHNADEFARPAVAVVAKLVEK